MSKKPPKRSPSGAPPPGQPPSKKPPQRSPSGTPVSPIKKTKVTTSPQLNPIIHTVNAKHKQNDIIEEGSEKIFTTYKSKSKHKKTSHNISSSMISWNEATTIDLALKSLVGLADEVIIVDTGSFDGTPKIASEWMDELDLSGQVKQVKVKNIGQARLEALQLCVTNWVMIQDSNIVLSEPLKTEILEHIKKPFKQQLSVKSLNLTGDYDHYFKSLPFMAPHYFVVNTDAKYSTNTERPYFVAPSINAVFWAVNLSRVRPAWRCWYRGEPFDKKHYIPKGVTPEAKGHMHEFNRQYVWHKKNSYYSLVDFIQNTVGLTIEDVKKISPKWYLDYLQSDAVPLTNEMKKGLPDVIKKEQVDPRYKLLYKNKKIVGRSPDL